MCINSQRLALVLLLLVAAPASAHAAGDGGSDAVAMIQDYSGESDRYRVVRETEDLRVKVLMELYAGDEIVLDSGPGKLTVVYYEGSTVEVDAESSPHVVVDSRTEKTVAGNLLRWAANVVGSWRGKKDEQLESMISRGPLPPVPPLAIPLLAGDESTVQATMRDLHLAWTGGRPPYEITLTRVSRKRRSVARLDGLDEPRAVVEDLKLKKGIYELVVVDSLAASVRGRFEARRKVELLELPAEALVGEASPAYEAVLSALYLSACGAPEFAFESYQRLSPHSAEYQPAELVARSLERGEELAMDDRCPGSSDRSR